jgi:hypothetical protein
MAETDPSRLGIEIGDRLAEWLTGNPDAMQGAWADLRATGLVSLWSAPLLFCGEPSAFLAGDDQGVFKFGRCLVRWVAVIARAAERGEFQAREPDGLSVMDKDEILTPDCVVRCCDLEQWAMRRHGLSVGFPTQEETTDPPPANDSATDWRNDPALLKSQKQARAVLAVIKAKDWPPLSVPDGKKGTIEKICRKDYPELFGGITVFETTWKGGVKDGLWRMQSHPSYAKRGQS